MVYRILNISILLNVAVICSLLAQESYYSGVSYKNFKESPTFNEQIDLGNINYEQINAAIFHQTNAIRSKKRLDILTYNPKLELAAKIHAEAMVNDDFFSHIHPKNKRIKTPDDRAKKAGIENPHLAENIATEFAITYQSGQKVEVIDKTKGIFKDPQTGNIIESHTYVSFAEAVVDSWMHSPPHKKNILSKEAIQLGVGTYFFKEGKNVSFPQFTVVQNFQWFENVR